jgi:hypothetical protein
LTLNQKVIVISLLSLMVGTTLLVSYNYLFAPFSNASPTTTEVLTQTVTSNFTAIVPITQTITSSSTIFSTPDQVSYVNATSGLMLQLSLNSTDIDQITPNDWTSILVFISEYNTRGTTNNITAANDWRMQGLSLGQCQNGPIGLGIFPGYYVLNNISAAGKSLSLFPPIFCPTFTLPQAVAPFYVFAPQSAEAEVQGAYSTQYDHSGNTTETFTDLTYNLESITSSVTLNSYCCREIVGGQNCGCYTYGYIPFQIGTYTIAGGDEWGDIVVTHFSVVTASLATSSSTNATQSAIIGTR